MKKSEIELLKKIIVALYGPMRGQTEFALNMGVDPRTVRRWLAGDLSMAPDRWPRVLKLIHDHEATLMGLRHKGQQIVAGI